MATRSEIYKCEICGNMVDVIHGGPGGLVCCGQTMRLLIENTTDASREKHVPVVELKADGVKVVVGSAAHPMEDKHYIEWIELSAGKETYRQYLSPGQAPEAFFPVDPTRPISVREYCTLHGLWKS